MRTKVAIFSHETRENERRLTVQYLQDAGITPDVTTIQTGEGSGFKNRLNAVTALEQAYDGHPVLLLEDDVLSNRHARAWIEYLEWNTRDVTCLCTMKPEFYTEQTEVALRNERRRTHTPSRLEVNPRLQHWWGSQALWLPARIIDVILADDRMRDETDNTLGPWDHTVRRVLMERDERMLMTYPSVFQHQSPPSVRQRKNRRQRLAAMFHPDAEPPKP